MPIVLAGVANLSANEEQDKCQRDKRAGTFIWRNAQDESLARLCPEYFTTKLAGYLASHPKQNMEKTL